MALIITEALLLGLMGGLIGVGVSRLGLWVLVRAPFIGDVLRGFPGLGLSPQIVGVGLGIALLLGLLAGFIPALMAYRSRITESLRQV